MAEKIDKTCKMRHWSMMGRSAQARTNVVQRNTARTKTCERKEMESGMGHNTRRERSLREERKKDVHRQNRRREQQK